MRANETFEMGTNQSTTLSFILFMTRELFGKDGSNVQIGILEERNRLVSTHEALSARSSTKRDVSRKSTLIGSGIGFRNVGQDSVVKSIP